MESLIVWRSDSSAAYQSTYNFAPKSASVGTATVGLMVLPALASGATMKRTLCIINCGEAQFVVHEVEGRDTSSQPLCGSRGGTLPYPNRWSIRIARSTVA